MDRLVMDYGRLIMAIIGLSTSLFLIWPNIKRREKQRRTSEKLRIIREALEHAEERVLRFQERHDRILSQICCYYLINQDLEEALAAARAAMNEALDFAVELRKMQMQVLRSFPDEVDFLRLDRRRPRN